MASQTPEGNRQKVVKADDGVSGLKKRAQYKSFSHQRIFQKKKMKWWKAGVTTVHWNTIGTAMFIIMRTVCFARPFQHHSLFYACESLLDTKILRFSHKQLQENSLTVDLRSADVDVWRMISAKYQNCRLLACFFWLWLKYIKLDCERFWIS